MQIEHSGTIKQMSDEQIEQAIAAIQAMLAARAGEAAQVNPGGSLEATRRSFNKDFLLALAADFKKHGAAAIRAMS